MPHPLLRGVVAAAAMGCAHGVRMGAVLLQAMAGTMVCGLGCTQVRGIAAACDVLDAPGQQVWFDARGSNARFKSELPTIICILCMIQDDIAHRPTRAIEGEFTAPQAGAQNCNSERKAARHRHI